IANRWRFNLKRLVSVISPALILLAAGAAQAQTLSVDKNPITLTALVGSTTPSTTTVNVTASGSSSVSWVAFNTNQTAAPWLKINGGPGASGNTPGSFTVSADPSNPTVLAAG